MVASSPHPKLFREDWENCGPSLLNQEGKKEESEIQSSNQGKGSGWPLDLLSRLQTSSLASPVTTVSLPAVSFRRCGRWELGRVFTEFNHLTISEFWKLG